MASTAQGACPRSVVGYACEVVSEKAALFEYLSKQRKREKGRRAKQPPHPGFSPTPTKPPQEKEASPSTLSPFTATMVSSSSSNKDFAAAAAFKEQMETIQERSLGTMDLGPPAWLTRPHCLEGPLSVDEVSV